MQGKEGEDKRRDSSCGNGKEVDEVGEKQDEEGKHGSEFFYSLEVGLEEEQQQKHDCLQYGQDKIK